MTTFKNRLAACLLACSIGAAAQSPDDGVRRALLIGIDDYAHVPRLRGCGHDTALVEHVLRSRYGFEDVRVLLDADATRAGILGALRRLVEDAGPEDVIHVHYSGHGAQVLDLDGDEEDGRDETLVPQDGRDPDARVADIVDDELAAIFANRKTDRVTIVLDACHSGSALRSVESRVRGRGIGPDDGRIELYRDLARVRSRDVVTSTLPFPVVTSARADQEALDGPVDGTYHGLFTAAWARAMESADPARTSLLEIHRRTGEEYAAIVERLRVRHKASTPVLEAQPKRRDEPMFPPADRLGARRSSVAVKPTADRHFVVLPNGARTGAGIGTAWALHAADGDLRAGRAIATGTVVRHDGADAILRVDRAARDTDLDATRAVRIAPAASPPTVTAALALSRAADPRDSALRDALAALLPEVDWVERAPASRPADFTIQVHRGDHRVFGDDSAAELATIERPRDARATAAVVARSLSRTDFMALENDASALGLRIWHDRNPGTSEPVRRRGIEIVAATGAQRTSYRVHRPGDPMDDSNCFLLNVRADQDGYLTVINIDDDGDTSVLFPNTHSNDAGYFPDGRIPSGESIRIPDEIADGNRAGFNLAYRKVGTEVVRAFFTEDLATAERIRSAFAELEERNAGLDPADFEAARNRQETFASLRSFLLGAALHDAATRGIEIVSNHPRSRPDAAAEAGLVEDGFEREDDLGDPSPEIASDWTAATIRVEVTP